MPLQLDTLILHFTKRVFLLYNEMVVICESLELLPQIDIHVVLKDFQRPWVFFFLLSNLFPIFPFQEPDLYRRREKILH